MKLYGSKTSPYVRKVRVCAMEQGVDLDFIVEAARDANVTRLNPLGKIPVLERDDGEALFDSPLIVEYLDSAGKVRLIPPSGEARWQAQRWHALSQGVLDAVVTRLVESRRVPEKIDAGAMAKQESKVAAALNFADQHYQGGDHLVGQSLTIADLAWAVALEYIDLRYAHDWRGAHPLQAAWLDTIKDRPSLVATRASAS